MKKVAIFYCLLMCSAAVADITDFSLPGLDGAQHQLSDYRGKWIVVNYWATWCPPCLDEIPDLIDFHDNHWNKDAVVLGINYESIGAEQLGAFVEDLFITYPILRSNVLPETPFGSIHGLPTTIIISPDGVAVARQVGPVSRRALEAYIARKTSSPSSTN